MKPRVHPYVSKDPVVTANAFIVESDRELVIIDTTLTRSDSRSLKSAVEALGKPIGAILLTHGHPDHVAGTSTIAPKGEVPIYALESVAALMRASEQAKHKQWSALFKDEWIPEWVYPNRIVNPGDTVEVDGLQFRILDLGAGGDSDANSIWLLETGKDAAFVGDFIFNQFHTYMADGSILRWIANLAALESQLSAYRTLYVGHGPPADATAIQRQRTYLATACANVLEATDGSAVFTDATRKKYERLMLDQYPGFGFQVTVSFSADAVAKELVGIKNYDW
jgi:glyoxylase-like metal-dependent hydrolase (beta-lactamase superfamily II)